MSCGKGHRCGSDLALLWCRLPGAAPIQPLFWESPYAAGVPIKKNQKQKQKKTKKKLTSHITDKDLVFRV